MRHESAAMEHSQNGIRRRFRGAATKDAGGQRERKEKKGKPAHNSDFVTWGAYLVVNAMPD